MKDWREIDAEGVLVFLWLGSLRQLIRQRSDTGIGEGTIEANLLDLQDPS